MPINYPPDYVPAARRSEEEVWADMDRRCNNPAGECRSIDISKASPPPEETAFRPSKFIKYGNRKKYATPGLASACGLNAAAKKRKAGK